MEALGAAASVAGLISLAVELPQLIDTARSIYAAPEEAAQLSTTVAALVSTLEQLEEFLKTEEARELTLAHDSALIVAISACQSRVLEISKKLQSHHEPSRCSGREKVKNAVRKFRWPYDKKGCMEVVAEVQAMQSTFKFCLVMKNWYVQFLLFLPLLYCPATNTACSQQMSKSHKEVISYFKIQGDTLAQMAAAFPDQAATLDCIVEELRLVGSCVSDASQRLDHLQLGLSQLGAMNKGWYLIYTSEC